MTVLRRLIVDGHNVLHSLARYAAALERDPSVARSRLVDDVASFAAGSWRATVVFDGAGDPGSPGAASSEGGVEVLFTPTGVEADTVVEALARAAREDGDEAVVVTSDAATQWTVLGGRVRLQSARAFGVDLADDAAERSVHDRRRPGGATVDEAIDAGTRTALLRLLHPRD